MADDFASRVQAHIPERKTGRTRLVLGTTVAAFLIGAGLTGIIVATGVFDSVSSEVAKMVEKETGEKVMLASPSSQSSAAQAELVQHQGGLDARMAGMEQRLNQIDLQSQASAGNAARAEGLLIAFSARRAVEQGEPLGYLESQLNLRFGAAEPGAVRDVINAAQNPMTLEQLTARLEDLSPVLAKKAEEGVNWAWFEREVGELFIVRKESAPSPLPQDRLARARLRLQSGLIDGAVGEVQNLPGGDSAAGRAWIADAQRYSKAMKALDRIERAAILEPRQLRDAGGKKVEQPSPAAPLVTGSDRN